MFIKRVLWTFGIQAEQGCSCESLANEMDQVGPDVVEANIDEWVAKMRQSITQWRKVKGSRIMVPPNAVIRSFLLWACHEVKRQEEKIQEIPQ